MTTIVAVRQALDYRGTLRAVGVCGIGWLVQVGLLIFTFAFLAIVSCLRNRKSRIVVQDEAGRPVGVVSLSDIARHDQFFAAEAMQQVSSRGI